MQLLFGLSHRKRECCAICECQSEKLDSYGENKGGDTTGASVFAKKEQLEARLNIDFHDSSESM